MASEYAPLYYVALDSTYDDVNRNRLESFVVDRKPQGPLADYIQLQDRRTACEPTGSSMYSERAGLPNRYAVLMPTAVKRAYHFTPSTPYVNMYNLAGFLTWLAENGYDTVDLKHVLKPENKGFWIQYNEATAPEFPRSAAVLPAEPSDTRVSISLGRTRLRRR